MDHRSFVLFTSLIALKVIECHCDEVPYWDGNHMPEMPNPKDPTSGINYLSSDQQIREYRMKNPEGAAAYDREEQRIMKEWHEREIANSKEAERTRQQTMFDENKPVERVDDYKPDDTLNDEIEVEARRGNAGKKPQYSSHADDLQREPYDVFSQSEHVGQYPWSTRPALQRKYCLPYPVNSICGFNIVFVGLWAALFIVLWIALHRSQKLRSIRVAKSETNAGDGKQSNGNEDTKVGNSAQKCSTRKRHPNPKQVDDDTGCND